MKSFIAYFTVFDESGLARWTTWIIMYSRHCFLRSKSPLFCHYWRKAINKIVLVSLSDWVILAFVVGLLMQELLAAIREGFLVYLSKWWNVFDSVIISLFMLSFVLWVSAYFHFGNKWKPEKNAFIAADVIYSSAIIISFFHLTHIFQVSD